MYLAGVCAWSEIIDYNIAEQETHFRLRDKRRYSRFSFGLLKWIYSVILCCAKQQAF